MKKLLASIALFLLASCAPNYVAHVEGNLWRSSRLSEAQMLQFGKIINLEGNNKYVEQERAFAEAHGIIWHHYALSESPFVKPSVATLLTIEADIEADPHIATDVHCRRGKDRTGVVIGDYRIIRDRWSPSAAYDEMKAYGHAWWFYPTWRSLLDEIAAYAASQERYRDTGGKAPGVNGRSRPGSKENRGRRNFENLHGR